MPNPKDLDLKLMLAGPAGAGQERRCPQHDQGLLDETGLTTNKGPLDKEKALVWLKLGQFYTEMRRWKDAEDALPRPRRSPPKTDDKTYLLFLKGALAERQKHLTSRPSSSSARRWNWTPTAP
jgi:hypothetical protein